MPAARRALGADWCGSRRIARDWADNIWPLSGRNARRRPTRFPADRRGAAATVVPALGVMQAPGIAAAADKCFSRPPVAKPTSALARDRSSEVAGAHECSATPAITRPRGRLAIAFPRSDRPARPWRTIAPAALYFRGPIELSAHAPRLGGLAPAERA
jgi:hypothetical protein